MRPFAHVLDIRREMTQEHCSFTTKPHTFSSVISILLSEAVNTHTCVYSQPADCEQKKPRYNEDGEEQRRVAGRALA